MPFVPSEAAPRCAVVDLGSNSVRLVVFEGRTRTPVPILNEKAVLRLGRGLTATGRLNDDAVARAVRVMSRFHAIARAMGADPFEVVATAAVRDAVNGPAFVEDLQNRMPGVPIRILSGEQEAELAALGMLSGMPDADGILADIGGGSLEMVRLRQGSRDEAVTVKLGVIRLAERAGGDLPKARKIVDGDLESIPWLNNNPGGCLYLVGGAFRALARVHMLQTGYKLNIVDHYTISADSARDVADWVLDAKKPVLEKLFTIPRRRLEDLPYAAMVLRRLLRRTEARQVMFSAHGLREGWFMQRMPQDIRAQEPLSAACRDMARALGRDPALPPLLMAWTAPIFAQETPEERNLREAACWLSDLGSHDHPEFRAEQSFLRALCGPNFAISHAQRAFLGFVLAFRYGATREAPYLMEMSSLLSAPAIRRAEQLGVALRLAYALSAGTPDLLEGCQLRPVADRLVLHLSGPSADLAAESVARRLEQLSAVFGLQAAIETDEIVSV